MGSEQETKCFPIHDPYRPGVIDVLVHENEKLGLEKIKPGYPVQVRGFWSWDIFPNLAPQNKNENKRKWLDEDGRIEMINQEYEQNLDKKSPPSYFLPMEKRVCIISDITG